MNIKNRKNKSNKIKHSVSTWKRVLSGIMVVVLVSGILPLEGIAPILKLSDISLSVNAEDVQDVGNNPTIMYYDELVDYSKAYAAHPESHHENDTISIAITSGLSTGLIDDFEGIGTQDNPFAGKIVINSNSFDNFNIKRAFFNYVYDYVEIEAQGTKQFTINTSGDNSGAVFAEHVVHDTTHNNITYDPEVAQADSTKTLKTPASWNIKVEDYQGNSHTHSSLIGEMGADAEVTVSILNNSTSSFSSSSGNVGAICGTMQTGSKLTVESVTGSNSAGVSATSGNAGGLVGEMVSGSELTVKSFPNTAAITAGGSNSDNKGYAGGLVGRNNQATVTLESTAPAIQNTVTGSSGAGGLYGYFKPVMTNSAYSLSLDEFSIGGDTSHRCKVSSSGGAGGFFGVLDNPGGTITLSGSSSNVIYAQGNGDNTVFGGIIGTYKADSLSDTLSVSGSASDNMLTVNTDKDGNLSYYGGIIGKIDGAGFACISNVNVTASSANDEFFGGAVACADDGYVYVNNLTLSNTSSYRGGSVVGRTANGVVHIAGATNLSSASSDAGVNYGQIVGYRDSALVFADSTWNLTRYIDSDTGKGAPADDVGSWGEVVRFGTNLPIGDVLSAYYDPLAETPVHYAKLKAASTTLGSVSAFALAALNMQLNNGTTSNTAALQFEDATNSAYSTLKSSNFTMSSDIDLSLTGITGLTRDNTNDSWTSGIGPQYSGSLFDGGSHKLTLAIGEGYEGQNTANAVTSGRGRIYRHRYNGLFGILTNDFTVKNLTVAGKISTYTKTSEPFYVGAIAGEAKKKLNASGVTIGVITNGSSDMKIDFGIDNNKENNVEIYVGGLAGKLDAPGATIIGTGGDGSSTAEYTGTANSAFRAEIIGTSPSDKTYVGGISGYAGGGGSITLYDVEIGGKVENTSASPHQRIGGLIANVAGGSVTIDGVTASSLTISGKMGTNTISNANEKYMGGLFGYCWDADSTFDHVSISSCTLNNNSTGGDMAGLINMGKGHWVFNSVAINGLALGGTSAASFGMLLNKAYSGNNAMYLELPSGFTYTIQNVSGTAPSVYDELAAYTVMPSNTIEANGNAVISINTNGTTRYGTMTASGEDATKVHMTSGSCNTYQNQVTATGFNKYNPNSRYYYNLDSYKSKSSLNAAENLFLYSVKQYAHSTILGNFTATTTSTFADGTGTDTLDLDGYSYYPFDVSGTVNIQGTLGLHNKEIEDNESASSGGSDGFARTTLNSTKTQHYLMHAGLFRNVSGTININGALAIDGTIPDADNYCGALICGTISGSTSADAKITSNITGASISLAGIMVHNKDGTYSPLLINKANTNVVLDIYHVSADSSKYTGVEYIATSLIGKVGSDTAEKVQVTFSDIKLDGRTAANTAESGLSSVYGTSHSLFTRATLLESLTYASGSGSSGVYNYTYNEDWGSSSTRNVTYGKEISDSNSVNVGKEYYYYQNFGEMAYFTNPSQDSTVANRNAVYDFSGFIPYVAVWGSSIKNSSTKHQLNVNHSAASFGGCGTYNHPFTIAATAGDKSGGLVTIAKIIANDTASLGNTYTISLPDDISSPHTWCEDKEECAVYTFNGSDTFLHPSDSSKDKNIEDVRNYLAGAYYYLSNDIEIDNSGFGGLGSSAVNSSDVVFHGVIAGNGKTITNKTTAPLIYACSGCVVKNLTIKPDGITFSVSTNNAKLFASSSGADTYGALIGRVMGGDNIIDQVTVDTTSANVSAGNYLATIGSYVGVVVEGGVFFRNMDKVKNNVLFSGGVFAESDKGHLYCNPYIGRVISGFAVNETASDTTKVTYAPYENGTRTFGDGTPVTGTQVSLQNSNKNYSITDLDPDLDKLTASSTSVAIPNSQAFFIMSLIINCGMGTNGTSVVGYYDANQITRHAEYNNVGAGVKESDYDTIDEYNATDARKDYAKTADDTFASPYLIATYTTGDYIKQLGSGSGFTLNVNDDIILPDGYKGIGSIFGTSFVNNNKTYYCYNDKLSLALKEFNGNNHKISQNTTFSCYTSSSSNGLQLDNYLPYVFLDNSKITYNNKKGEDNSLVHGLGLFNYVNLSSAVTFKDCSLSGNVVFRQYSGGNVLSYTSSLDKTSLVAGSLAGVLNMKNNASVSDVYLQNVYVESTREAGGMIGYLINDTKKISVTNKADTADSTAYQSSKIYVNAGTSAAGLIARQGNAFANQSLGRGDISIDLNNHHFDFTSIISRYDGSHTRDQWNSDWALGIGGLVGVARGNDAGSNSNTISISNVKIGTDTGDNLRMVSCEYVSSGTTAYGVNYVGGLVGVFNRCPVNITNCDVNNVNVSSKLYAGGLVGWGGTASEITIDNCNLNNNLTSKVYSSSDNAGGIVGYCKDDMGKFTVKNSTVDSYTIEGVYAGGALGNWQASSNAFSLVNSVINNCTVKYSTSGGGIAGQLKKNLYGYNVRVSGITFTPSGTAQQGYITGKRDGGIIKITGFHRTGTVSEAKLIGNNTDNKMSNMYGTGGYVIFADYEGKSTLDTKNSAASNVNLSNAARVSDFGAEPYVTINPSITLDSNIGLITGDGMSINAVNSILTDNSSKKYAVAGRADIGEFLNDNDGVKTVKTDIVSTFKTELGDMAEDAEYNFPMLVINNTDTADAVLNHYLRVLTNTDDAIDFSYRNGNDQSSKIIINNQNNTNFGIITIRKCNYNNGTITVSSQNNDASLIFGTTNTFQIRKTNNKEQYDTATPGQFTLIDVAFKDPSDANSVAYHLYVPVIVKKLVEYNFDVSVLSGTTYDKTLYGTETNGIRGRALLENLGSPVTFEFDYSYLRTASEWAAEDQAYKYDKYLSFSNGGNYNFGSGTKAVLIDLNRGGVAYYLDNWTSGFNSTTKLLNLQAFTNASGTSFTPMTFQEMIAAKGASFTGDATLTESYYLTIYTPKYERGANDNSTQVAHYTVASEPFTDSQHPSRRVDCESQTTRQPHNSVHLIIGDFYNNTLTVSTTNSNRMMSASNRQIGVNLSATIDVVNAETHQAIDQYLGYTDIKIYQSYLLAFEKYLVAGTKAETGISAIDDCSVDFTITRGTTNVNVTREAVVPSHNYVELQNNTDISSQLRLGAVTINASATMSFNNEETRNAQFPKATESDNGIGALVIGSSNISSQPENTAYSTASITRQDSNSRYYYRTNEQAAILNYHADYSGATKANQRGTQLGINARELEVDVPTKDAQTIYTEVRYDASGLLNADKIEYIKCVVKLYRKTGMTNNVPTYETVPINQFLRNLTVNGTKTQEYTTYSSSDVASSEFAYVYSVSNVDQFTNEENVFKIPIVFDAISGNSTGFRDTDGYIYANYKVEVTVSAFDENHSTDATPWTSSMLNSTPPPDYVIYTNARVFTDEYVNPN